VLVRLLPIVVIGVALVVYFAGAPEVALALLLVGVVAMVASHFLRRTRSAPPPELSPEQTAALRAERERSGEVAAVRLLRREHPGVSLADAVRLVRALRPGRPGPP
jgi:hypothetical protein